MVNTDFQSSHQNGLAAGAARAPRGSRPEVEGEEFDLPLSNTFRGVGYDYNRNKLLLN